MAPVTARGRSTVARRPLPGSEAHQRPATTAKKCVNPCARFAGLPAALPGQPRRVHSRARLPDVSAPAHGGQVSARRVGDRPLPPGPDQRSMRGAARGRHHGPRHHRIRLVWRPGRTLYPLYDGLHIIAGEFGKLTEKLCHGHSSSQVFENIVDRDTGPAHARLARSPGRINDNVIQGILHGILRIAETPNGEHCHRRASNGPPKHDTPGRILASPSPGSAHYSVRTTRCLP